jgi:hypothetical protein
MAHTQHTPTLASWKRRSACFSASWMTLTLQRRTRGWGHHGRHKQRDTYGAFSLHVISFSTVSTVTQQIPKL